MDATAGGNVHTGQRLGRICHLYRQWFDPARTAYKTRRTRCFSALLFRIGFGYGTPAVPQELHRDKNYHRQRTARRRNRFFLGNLIKINRPREAWVSRSSFYSPPIHRSTSKEALR